MCRLWFGLVVMLAALADGRVIFHDSFERDAGVQLIGTVPDVTDGCTRWRGTPWAATGDGTVKTVEAGAHSAFLDFAPESGRVYTLSVVARVNERTDVQKVPFAVGFISEGNASPGMNWFRNADSPWIRIVPQTATGGYPLGGLGAMVANKEVSGTVFPNVGKFNTYSIELDTTGGAWKVSFAVNGYKLGKTSVYTYDEPPKIAGFGFGQSGQGVVNVPGEVDSIELVVESIEGDERSLQSSSERESEKFFGGHVNAEHVRAKKIEALVDAAENAEETLEALRQGWRNPPSTYRPHTRWWWPGNAVTKEGIDFQLREMKDKGLGGVEIMSYLSVYEKGSVDYNSDAFVRMVQYAVDKARALGMEVTPPLVPGWNHGHACVLEEDGAKAMVYYESDVDGGHLSLRLSDMKPRERAKGYERNGKRVFDALIAVALDRDGVPDVTRRIDLTGQVSGSRGLEQFVNTPDLSVAADLPDGCWRLMGFWTVLTGQTCSSEQSRPRTRLVDLFQKSAVEEYLKNSVTRFEKALGDDYGQTIDSFFGDSWEIINSFCFWSTGMYKRFEEEKGYDLRPYLPLLVYDGAPETPYVRYDVNHFLHNVALETMVHPLADYAASRNVQMRQQPHYRFPTDIIMQSGIYQRPETENTKRSFDPMIWHKLTASGAWLYPSKEKRWVSAEAFTFINAKYFTTMEEIKHATDLFIRDGVSQFYNHGYFYTPEKELAPSRDLIWGNRISHVNTWWPWYRGLADYQARCCFMARQGRPECDVLVYAPYPTMWSDRIAYPAHDIRDLPLGELTKLLVANGYDFDCVNDDLLLNHAEVRDGKLVINGFDYSVLILPRARVFSPDALAKVGSFVRSGGTVLVLADLSHCANGMKDREEKEKALSEMCSELFNGSGGSKTVEKGFTYFFPDFDGLDYLTRWNPAAEPWRPTAPLSSAQSEFIRVLRSRLTPDFETADVQQSNGLTFRHSIIGQVDCWFLCNLQPTVRKTEVTLNTKGKVPQVWDAMTGSFQRLESFRGAEDGRVVILVDLQPWESEFVLLTPPGAVDLPESGCKKDGAWSRETGFSNGWNVSFQGLGGFETSMIMSELTDWVKIPGLKDFSGTATYCAKFEMADSGMKTVLDLGEVHEVASVRVNGEEAGKVWMSPYRVDISEFVKAGPNQLEITVANLLWNYAGGLKEPTPVPEGLQEHYGSGRSQPYGGWSSLQDIVKNRRGSRLPSGLLGPVRLLAAE